MGDFGCGDYPVTVIHNHWIHLSDGTRLASRLWLPFDKADLGEYFDLDDEDIELLLPGQSRDYRAGNCPGILEYLPYFKDILTFERDFTRHQWFASHGFVSARVEMRGTGNSDGLYFGEYLQQEQEDCLEVIDYLGTRKWSNGKVAMYGKSWGGFNGLQMAALRPPRLATVISLYSTDWRYGNDIHYLGNCMLGDGMVSWANEMHMRNAMPPNPKYCDNWLEKWKYRLENSSESWLKEWLFHPYEDDFWKHASIKDHPESINVPVLIIGGLADGYTDGAFRMAAGLNNESRAIIGPWGHDWPDESLPGPQIDFLNICLSWFKYNMIRPSASSQDVSRWPRLQVFVQDAHPPQPFMTTMPGCWKSLSEWPKAFAEFERNCGDSVTRFYLTHGSLDKAAATSTEEFKLSPHALQGLGAPAWLSWGVGDTVSPDQSVSTRICTRWLSQEMATDLAICGYSKLRLNTRCTTDGLAAIAASLLDVYEDQYTLITYGVQNVGPGFRGDRLIKQDDTNFIEIAFKPTTYLLPQGHSLVLAISPTYFPRILPTPGQNEVTILEQASCLSIQTPPTNPHDGFPPPKPLMKVERQIHRIGGRPDRTFNLDLYSNEAKIKHAVKTDDAHIPSIGLSLFRKDIDEFTIHMNTLEWAIHGNRSIQLTYPAIDAVIDINATAEMVPFGDRLRLSQELKVNLNNEEFFTKCWKDEVDRKCP